MIAYSHSTPHCTPHTPLWLCPAADDNQVAKVLVSLLLTLTSRQKGTVKTVSLLQVHLLGGRPWQVVTSHILLACS